MISWILVVYGVTLVITGSRLLRPFRDWLNRHRWWKTDEFVRCPMCVGFWIGFASWFVFSAQCPVQVPHWYISAPANAFASAAVCWSLHVILAKLGAEQL